MNINGFYVLNDDFFNKVKDPYLKDNKEGNRPYYYCIAEERKGAALYWMIPLTSRIEKYKKIIAQKEVQHKPTDGLYICKLPTDKESVFLIQDMFPVTLKYIEREYTLAGNPLTLVKEKDIKSIRLKAKRVINLIKRGVKLTPTSPNVSRIIELLTKSKQS